MAKKIRNVPGLRTVNRASVSRYMMDVNTGGDSAENRCSVNVSLPYIVLVFAFVYSEQT